MKNFIAKLVGKYLKNEIKLEDTVDNVETKKWWKSKRIWNGVAIVLIGAYESAATYFGYPNIPPFIYSLLGGLGIVLNKTSTAVIK